MQSNKLLPEDFQSWNKKATALALATTAISGLPKVESASHFTETDFIALRAYWPEREDITQCPFFKEDPDLRVRANHKLKSIPGFKAFVKDMANSKKGYNSRLSQFVLVKDSWSQLLDLKDDTAEESEPVVRRSSRLAVTGKRKRSFVSQGSAFDAATGTTQSPPSEPSVFTADGDKDPPSDQRTHDEEIVNVALLELLRALTLPVTTTCRWTVARAPFNKAQFGENSFTARVDGFLYGSERRHVFAIAEVKPRTRDRNKRPQAYWQHTAEMVAWILHEQKPENKVCPHT